jgi:hypothetical protein
MRAVLIILAVLGVYLAFLGWGLYDPFDLVPAMVLGTLHYLVMAGATVCAVYGRPSQRRFWLGFCAVAWVFVLLTWRDFSPTVTDYLGNKLVQWRLARRYYLKDFDTHEAVVGLRLMVSCIVTLCLGLLGGTLAMRVEKSSEHANLPEAPHS